MGPHPSVHSIMKTVEQTLGRSLHMTEPSATAWHEKEQVDCHEPEESPLSLWQVHAALVCSVNEPIMRPRPSVHSIMNAVVQTLGRSLRMKEPSATTLHVPAIITSAGQLLSPIKRIKSQIQVFPQSSSTSRIVVGGGHGADAAVMASMLQLLGC